MVSTETTKLFFPYKHCFHLALGGLFTADQREEEFFFRLAVNNINEDTSILSRTKLVAQVKSIDYYDSFHANKRGKQASKVYHLI